MGEYSPRTILLATDGSEDAELASKVGTELSAKTNAELHVVHAWHLPTRQWRPAVFYPSFRELHQQADSI